MKKKSSIKINPAHKGDFTAFAKRHGKTVQQMATEVLANKEHYSTHVVEMANFAHNFRGKKAQAGSSIPDNILWGNPGAGQTPSVLASDNAGSSTDIFGTQYFKTDPTQQGAPAPDDVLNNNSSSVRTRKFLGFKDNPYIDAFNKLAVGVTGVANAIQNNNLKRRENLDVMHSLEPRYNQNMEGEGLNNLPMYTQYGGGDPWFISRGGIHGAPAGNVGGGNHATEGDNDDWMYEGFFHKGPYGKTSVYQYGGNNSYYAAGGKYAVVRPYGGGPLNANGAKEILRDGTVHGRPLTDKQKRYFGWVAGGKKQTGGGDDQAQQIMQAVAQQLQQGADPKQILQQLVQSGIPQDQAVQIIQQVAQQLQGGQQDQGQDQQQQQAAQMQQYGGCDDCDHDQMKAGGKNWIQGAIKHPGRCSNPGDSRCPKGSPQYKLAMRFKHGDLKKKQLGGSADLMSSVNEQAGPAKTIAATTQTDPRYNLSDSINFLLTNHATGDKKQLAATRDIALQNATKLYGLPKAQKLISHIDVYNQGQNANPQNLDQAVSSFYDTTGPNSDINDIKYQLKNLGSGQLDIYHNTPVVGSGNVAVNSILPQQQQRGTYQAGGTPITHGLPDGMAALGNVNAEEGEVFQDGSNRIMKVADNAGTHEQGGVMLPNVQRVLENTSALRKKDPASKMLALTPDEVQQMFGFKPKKNISHADAYEQAVEHYGKKHKEIQQNNKVINNRPEMDKYSANSAKLNFQNASSLPTQDEVFDMLFGHQEFVKNQNGIQDDGTMANMGGKYTCKAGGRRKAQAGADATTPDLGLYKGPSNKSGRNLYSPTGKTTEAKISDKEILDRYKAAGIDLGNVRGKALQTSIYNYLVDNQPDVLRQTLKEYGPNIQSEKLGLGKSKAFTDPMNASKEDLKAVLPGLIDAMPGARIPLPDVSSQTDNQYPTPTTPAPASPGQRPPLDTNVTVNPRFIQQPDNRFNEPTYWDELAPGALSLADSMVRDPELYNPQDAHQLHYKLQDPTAALNANQSDYEAIASSLGNSPLGSGVNAANLANLSAQKYKANNQVLGAYDNQNANIKNNEITYNTQVRDRQSALDANSRGQYYRNVQIARDNQRLQRLKAIEDLGRVLQMKRRQNNSGNLVLKLSPAFNQQGDYNGYQYAPVLPPELAYASQQQTAVPAKGKPSASKTRTTTTWKLGDRTVKTYQSQ